MSFKSLFLVKRLASILDQSHHLLVKFSCRNFLQENTFQTYVKISMPLNARPAVCF